MMAQGSNNANTSVAAQTFCYLECNLGRLQCDGPKKFYIHDDSVGLCVCSCAAGDCKNAHLKTLEGAGERLQLVRADLLDYDSVASAVAGCEGVFHVASPVPSGRSTNPEVNY
jgi:hypothetical protein